MLHVVRQEQTGPSPSLAVFVLVAAVRVTKWAGIVRCSIRVRVSSQLIAASWLRYKAGGMLPAPLL